MNPDIIFSKSLEKSIPSINYLTEGSEFIESFTFDPRKGAPITQLKKILKKDYFPDLADSDILDGLNQNQGFENYQKIKNICLYVFTAPENEQLEKVLENLYHINQQQPDDFIINKQECQTQLNKYNKLYGQWIPAEKVALYSVLVCRCRQVIALFENNPSNKDEMAFEYAYKIMAIFDESGTNSLELNTALYNISRKLTSFLKSTNNLVNHYHDVFFVLLRHFPQEKAVEDKEGWKKLLNDKKSDKKKALNFFCQAEKFEKKILQQTGLRRAPENYKEAVEIAPSCTYDRASEDPSFALLCHKYDVLEKDFNRCLNYIQKNQIEKKDEKFIASKAGWPKKEVDSDNIPNLCILGSGEAQGFYWLKLRSDDKRALILGQITDCCQHIGGDSEACVRDAVQRADNGLYILVKAKKADIGPPNPLELLDENNYKIVGQSYVWLSKTGNLCLDSIECLKNEISVGGLHSILNDFGHQLITQYPNIKRVTLGRGGKTPSDIFPKTLIAEKMNQGHQYDDSEQQYQVTAIVRNIDLDFLLNFTQSAREVINFLHLYFDEHDLLINLNQFISVVPKQSVREKILYRFAQCLAKYGSQELTLSMLTPVRVDDFRILQNAPLLQIFIHSDLEDLQFIFEYINEEKGRLFVDLLLEMSDNHEDYAEKIIGNIDRVFHNNKVISYFIEKVDLSYESLLDLLPTHNKDIALAYFLKWSHPSQILTLLINNSELLEKYTIAYFSRIENLHKFEKVSQYLAGICALVCQQHNETIDRIFEIVLQKIIDPFKQAHLFRKFLFLQDNSEEKMKLKECLPINPLNYPAKVYSLEQLMLSITHPEHLRHILKHFPEKEEIIISRVLLMEPGVVIAAVLYEPEIRGYLNECDISNEIERLIQPGSFYDYDNAISSMLLYKIFQQPDQNVLDFFRLYPQAHDFLLNNKSYEYFLDMFWRFPQISQDRNFREPYIKAIVDNWDHIDFEQFFNKKMSEGFIEGIFVLLVEELSRKQCSDFCTALWKYNPELLLDFIKKYDSTMTGRFETRADEENTKHDKIDLLDMYDQFTSTITPAEIKNFLINYHNLNTSLLGEDEVVSCIEPNAILQLLRFDGLYTIDNYFKRLIECSEISRFDSVTREVYQNFLGQFSDIERAKLFLKYPYACAMLSIHTGDHSFWNFIENEPITETRTEIMGITERYRPKRTQEDANITGQKRGFLNSDSDGSDNENAFFKDTRRRL